MDGDHKYFDKSRLLCLVGDNGGGKTLVLSTLKYLSKLMTDGAISASHLVPVTFDSSEEEKYISISIVFLADYIKYNYIIYVRGGVVEDERLFYTPHVRKTLLYKRKIDENGVTNITIGDSLRMTPVEKNNLKTMLSKEKTLLQSYSNLTFHRSALDVAWKYMSQQLCHPSIIGLMDGTAKEFIDSYPEMNKILNEMADKGIINNKSIIGLLQSIRQEALACPENISGNLHFRQYLGRRLCLLSSGEADFLQSLLLLVTAYRNNGVCVIDDFADKMDTPKAMALLDCFLTKNGCSQFVFSTHNTSLLDYDFLRREQVAYIFHETDGSISTDQKLAKALHKYISLANAYKRGLRPSVLKNKKKFDNDGTQSVE